MWRSGREVGREKRRLGRGREGDLEEKMERGRHGRVAV